MCTRCNIKPGAEKNAEDKEVLSKLLKYVSIDSHFTSIKATAIVVEEGITIPLECRYRNENPSTIWNVLEIHKKLFRDGYGKITEFKAKVRVQEGSKPTFHKQRPFPYSLKEARKNWIA